MDTDRRTRGLGFAVGIPLVAVLFVIENANILAPEVVFRRTSGSYDHDAALYFTRMLNRQRRVLWDLVVRDTSSSGTPSAPVSTDRSCMRPFPVTQGNGL